MIIRKAIVTDAQKIEHMVKDKKDKDNWLNPIGLKWQNFWVVEEKQTLIACGQLRPWGKIKELSSLTVLTSYRRKKIGTYLVQYLIQQTDTTIYLSCASNLKSFYNISGFKQISWSKIPNQLKPEFGLSKMIATIRSKQLIFMKYQ